jgi:hypothetical protein
MQNLVANIAGIITKYEGKKFLQLPDTIDETLINWSHSYSFLPHFMPLLLF